MTDWNDRAAAIIYAWYPGQIGNRALAEVLCGETNPSGKLPITIERRFEDSPAYGYIPTGEQLDSKFTREGEAAHPIYHVVYQEGIFIGYRWYEKNKIAPLYAFGTGLSYTTFQYNNLRVSTPDMTQTGHIDVQCTISNTGRVAGAEIAQVYVHPVRAPVAWPEKELKGFAKVKLAPGESHDVTVTLSAQDFAYWNIGQHDWTVAPGEYEVLVGSSSNRIALQATVTVH
jgi:beta-glucosidase